MSGAVSKRFTIPALLLWSVVAVVVTALYGHFAMDDFFITYRYAENLASGRGFVFNPGERVLGLTEPGQGVLLAALRLFTRVPVPWLGTVVTALGLLGLAWVMLREAQKSGTPWSGLVGGTLVVTMTFFWGCRGAGVIPGLALLAWAAADATQRPIVAGLAAGAAVWLRPELAVGVALLALLLSLEEKRLPWRFGLATGAVLSVGTLACWLYFGTVVPITLGAKQSFAAWDPVARSSGAHFWPGFVPLLARHFGPTWWLFFGLAAVGMVGRVGRRSQGRHAGRPRQVLWMLGALLAVVYPLLGVPLFWWYVIPCLAAGIYGFAQLFDLAAERLPRPAAVVVCLALAALTWPCFRSLAQGLLHPGTSMQYESYRAAGQWIRERSPAEARIAALEVGTLAYFADRPVTDLLGLVSPEVAEHVRSGQVIAGLEARPTEFFVLTQGLEGLIGPVRSLPWFVRSYELVHTLPAEGGEMWIFQRRP